MKLEADGTIVLSRRNLLALLTKLDGHPPNSHCMIEGGYEARGVVIRAEEDEAHYSERPAGEMHPDTEERITKPATGVEPGLDWRAF